MSPYIKAAKVVVWLTQLGLSVLVPLAGFILLGAYLRNSRGWGDWVVLVGIALGLFHFGLRFIRCPLCIDCRAYADTYGNNSKSNSNSRHYCSRARNLSDINNIFRLYFVITGKLFSRL